LRRWAICARILCTLSEAFQEEGLSGGGLTINFPYTHVLKREREREREREPGKEAFCGKNKVSAWDMDGVE
jgi:hypothetical protein